jgi:UDP-N-acetylglucosamine 2-epimerase (non-hydrolysing)
MNLPIGIVFGTRPEYLKVKPLFSAFQREAILFYIIQVNQHVDLSIEERNEPNFIYISLPDDTSTSRLNMLASTIPKLVESTLKKCSSIIVQGDTATVFFSAIAAFHLKLPIYHLEAGLRTYDLNNPYPEEAYRSMLSRIASYHLCPDIGAQESLIKENITKEIHVVGNTILDLVRSYNFTPQIGTTVLITVHRRENWDSMEQIVKSIAELAKQRPDLQFKWIQHMNPCLQKIVTETLTSKGWPDSIQVSAPLDHKELCKIITESYCIITDSGGIQEEASFLGKTCFVLRKKTERSSIPAEYIHLIQRSEDLLKEFQKKTIVLLSSCKVYGDGFATDRIIDLLKEHNKITNNDT